MSWPTPTTRSVRSGSSAIGRCSVSRSSWTTRSSASSASAGAPRVRSSTGRSSSSRRSPTRRQSRSRTRGCSTPSSVRGRSSPASSRPRSPSSSPPRRANGCSPATARTSRACSRICVDSRRSPRRPRPRSCSRCSGPYHETIGELIPAHGGTLEHFAGDGIMVFFNDPVAVDDHELAAIRLALAAQERFAELSSAWRKRGTELGLGIGIEAGYATRGADRLRRSLRLRGARLGGEPRLAAQHPRVGGTDPRSARGCSRRWKRSVLTEPVGDVELKGFGKPVAAYEVRGIR